MSSAISRAASYKESTSEDGSVCANVQVLPDAVAAATRASEQTSSVRIMYSPVRSLMIVCNAGIAVKSMSCCEMNTPPAWVDLVTVLALKVILVDETAAPSVCVETEVCCEIFVRVNVLDGVDGIADTPSAVTVGRMKFRSWMTGPSRRCSSNPAVSVVKS